MKIRTIKINGFMGIDDLEIQPGALTIIQGRNGSGKTSVIEALKATLGSGHDPSVVRIGADAAIAQIDLDDGTTIRMRVTAKATTRDIRDEKGRKITRSAEYIRSITDALSVDPIAFITAKPADQLTAFLEAVPLRLEAQALSFLPAKVLTGISLDRHALEVLALLDRDLRADRQEINRVAREKEATAKQLAETLPPEAPDGTNWSEELARLTKEYLALREATSEWKTRILADERGNADAVKQTFHQEREKIRAGLESAIAVLRSNADAAIKKREEARDERLSVIATERDNRMRNLEIKYTPRQQELTLAQARAQELVTAQAKSEKTREFIISQERDAGAAREQSDAVTQSIGKIEALKRSLLREMPIPGIEVKDGVLLVDGVPFARVNLARQIQVAIELAKLRAGELGLVVLDNLEHFDSEAFSAFRVAAQASGLQFVGARVENSDFVVNTDKDPF